MYCLNGSLRFILEVYEKSFDIWIAGMVWTFCDIFVQDESEKFLGIALVTRHDLLCSYT